MSLVEHGCEPVEVEFAVARFPRGPHRLADADQPDAGLDHQAHVLAQSRGVRQVLVVVGGAEQRPMGEGVQAVGEVREVEGRRCVAHVQAGFGVAEKGQMFVVIELGMAE